VIGQGLPEGYHHCFEIRNPNWLRGEYFDYLAEHGIGHVFLQGYYMPPIFEAYWQFREKLADPVVTRLHGPDRKAMEERTGEIWDKIIEPRDMGTGRSGPDGRRPEGPAAPDLHQRQQPLRRFSTSDDRQNQGPVKMKKP
jgi:hypothetical protein